MRYSPAEKGNNMDNLTREMRICERAGFGASYGKWKATQPIKEKPIEKTTEKKVCQYCGAPIAEYKNSKRFCNYECSNAAWKARKLGRKSRMVNAEYDIVFGENEVLFEKNCEWCGKPFLAKRKSTMYCEKSCGSLASYYRKRDRLEAEKARND